MKTLTQEFYKNRIGAIPESRWIMKKHCLPRMEEELGAKTELLKTLKKVEKYTITHVMINRLRKRGKGDPQESEEQENRRRPRKGESKPIASKESSRGWRERSSSIDHHTQTPQRKTSLVRIRTSCRVRSGGTEMLHRKLCQMSHITKKCVD